MSMSKVLLIDNGLKRGLILMETLFIFFNTNILFGFNKLSMALGLNKRLIIIVLLLFLLLLQ
jgi:hypothetical protein